MNTPVCAVSFYQAETPLALIEAQLAIITHNTIRHCRVRSYAFVGQPFTAEWRGAPLEYCPRTRHNVPAQGSNPDRSIRSRAH